MKRSELKQIIKEEIIKEVKNTYIVKVINVDNYKSGKMKVIEDDNGIPIEMQVKYGSSSFNVKNGKVTGKVDEFISDLCEAMIEESGFSGEVQ